MVAAERDRYKAALEWIANNSGHVGPCKGQDLKDCMGGCDVQIKATEALNGKA